MTVGDVLLGLLAVVVVGSLAGTLAALAFQTLSTRGERARIAAAIEPLADEIDALGESFHRWRNKYAKRVRDDGEQQAFEWDPERPPRTAAEREAIKARLRAMHGGA